MLFIILVKNAKFQAKNIKILPLIKTNLFIYAATY